MLVIGTVVEEKVRRWWRWHAWSVNIGVCCSSSNKKIIIDTFFLPADKSEILKKISGEFRGCELSAVVGKSGSGKTSLLNVLSGYTTCNVSGSVRINGRASRNDVQCKSNYITQDYSLHPFITVYEAMQFAANLKLNHINVVDRNRKVSEKQHYIH